MWNYDPLKPSKAKKHTCEAYHFWFQSGGWAIFTINDETGEFGLTSDWGNYAHRWPRDGVGSLSMKMFLASTNPHYIADKFSYQSAALKDVFDDEATERSFRRAVLEARRSEKIDSEYALDLWRDIDALEWGAGRDFMVASVGQELAEFLDGTHDYIRYEPSPSHKTLVERLLPFFIDHLREELGMDTLYEVQP